MLGYHPLRTRQAPPRPGTPPGPGRHPPGTGTPRPGTPLGPHNHPPPGPGTPLGPGRHPPRTRHPLPRTRPPPRSRAYWEIRSTSGWYASCWNAILLNSFFCEIILRLWWGNPEAHRSYSYENEREDIARYSDRIFFLHFLPMCRLIKFPEGDFMESFEIY